MEQQQNNNIICIEILDAYYIPCEEQLQHHMKRSVGESNTTTTTTTFFTNQTNNVDCIPYTRNVTPFVRALLVANKLMEEKEENLNITNYDDEIQYNNKLFNYNHNIISFKSVIEKDNFLVSRTEVPLFSNDEQPLLLSMNGVFGDPSPGVSKRLHVHYKICVVGTPETLMSNGNNEILSESISQSSWETYTASFAEHENKISLRCHHAFDQAKIGINSADTNQIINMELASNETLSSQSKAVSISALGVEKINTNNRKTVNTTIFETVLPFLLKYMTIPDRVQCRLVCTSWCKMIQEWGIASVIDDTDKRTFPYHCNKRRILRGLIQHSYCSLHTLSLSNTPEIETNDIHPVIPHLSKLRSLDLSRCKHLNDTTLVLLAQYLHMTLEVLYLKGLRHVSDIGIIAIAQSCYNIQVLEISFIPVTDKSGIAIGQNLTNLRALYMRDNYLLTNHSIDIITRQCRHLEQLTLWGCIELDHLSFDLKYNAGDDLSNQDPTSPFESINVSLFPMMPTTLISLNLWGCHRLCDDTAKQFKNMKQLKTLILSECHQISDNFVCTLAVLVPTLHHLHLGYCKQLTDTSINAIAMQMKDIYSLDVSFCTRITISSISTLLQTRSNSLAELRLKHCQQIEIGIPLLSTNEENSYGMDGKQILDIIQSNDSMCLSILDVRYCGSQNQTFFSNGGYHINDPFVDGMSLLLFEQKVPGFFVRKARWNHNVHCRFVKSILSQQITKNLPVVAFES